MGNAIGWWGYDEIFDGSFRSLLFTTRHSTWWLPDWIILSLVGQTCHFLVHFQIPILLSKIRFLGHPKVLASLFFQLKFRTALSFKTWQLIFGMPIEICLVSLQTNMGNHDLILWFLFAFPQRTTKLLSPKDFQHHLQSIYYLSI